MTAIILYGAWHPILRYAIMNDNSDNIASLRNSELGNGTQQLPSQTVAVEYCCDQLGK